MAIKELEVKRGPLVLVTSESGVTVIPQPTPLTRLNYFDGKFLRASDLKAEQALHLRAPALLITTTVHTPHPGGNVHATRSNRILCGPAAGGQRSARPQPSS